MSKELKIENSLKEFPDAIVVHQTVIGEVTGGWHLECSKCKAGHYLPAMFNVDHDVTILLDQRCIRRTIRLHTGMLDENDNDILKDYRSCDNKTNYIIVKK